MAQQITRLALFVFLLLSLAVLTVCSAESAGATTCTGSLQAKINNAPSGGVVYADACIYREKVTINKPITLDGGGDSEIRGSDVWAASRFDALSNGTWKATGYPSVPPSDGRCEPGTSRCRWPEQVYYDGQPLTQVAPSATPQDMQFAVNSNRDLIVGANPAGHLVEVTVRDGWVTGAQNASGVTIRGFTMQHATGNGIYNRAYSDWAVKNCHLSYAHRMNLTLTIGSGLVASDVHSHHAGQLGLNGTSAKGLTVQGGEYDDNNTEQFDAHWHAGGMKIASANTVTVDGANVHHNNNNGIWIDVPESGPQDIVVSNNSVHHNPGHGIRVEVQTNIEVFGNSVWENGWRKGAGGITVGASSDVSVHDNVLAWNDNGIRINNPRRTDTHPDEDYYDYVRNNKVFSNTIVQQDGSGRYALGWFEQWSGGNIYNSAANNRGHDDRYYYPTAEGSATRYRWTDSYRRLADFNATPGEERGVYMTADQKDTALQEAGIPTQPAPH